MEITFFNYPFAGLEQCLPEEEDLQTLVESELADLTLSLDCAFTVKAKQMNNNMVASLFILSNWEDENREKI